MDSYLMGSPIFSLAVIVLLRNYIRDPEELSAAKLLNTCSIMNKIELYFDEGFFEKSISSRKLCFVLSRPLSSHLES